MKIILKNKILWVKIAAAVLVAALSFFVAAKAFVPPDAHEGTLQYLDDKKVAVLELAGAATATSLAISALPDDVATPIAEEIADLISYFLIIVSAIVLEKYLVVVTGFAAFKVFIPAACLLFILYLLTANRSLRKTAVRLLCFALAIFLLIPVSVGVSRLIDKTYDHTAAQAVESAKENADALGSGGETAVPDTPPQTGTDTTSGSWWERLAGQISDAASALKESTVGKVTVAKDKLQDLLNSFIDALAILIVTSCVIPIIILLAFLWIIKLAFGIRSDGKKDSDSLFRRRNEKEEAGSAV